MPIFDTFLKQQTERLFLREATHIEEIQKGHSGDGKYIITYQNGTKHLLKLAPLQNFERKQAEFQILKDLQPYGIQTSQPIDVGRIEELDLCYNLLSYLEGEEARDILPHCTEDEQYRIGLEAGRDLARYHLHPAPAHVTPWYDRCVAKHRRYVAAYRTIGVTIQHADKILAFIEENLDHITDRPNLFQHDDFHVGNIIVRDKAYVGAIDINRYDWGDPFHEFVKVALFSRETSVPFSVGQLDGYFETNQMPADFWRIYSVYVAMAVFSSIVWTMRVMPDEIDSMINRLHRVLEDHQNFERLEPTWYREAKQ